MPKATAQSITTQLHNLPLPAIVDELGNLKAQIADLEAREKALREALIGSGAVNADGDSYSATIAAAIRWTLDSKSVRSEMGEAWWNARCWQGVVTTVTVKPRAVPAQLAA